MSGQDHGSLIDVCTNIGCVRTPWCQVLWPKRTGGVNYDRKAIMVGYITVNETSEIESRGALCSIVKCKSC